MTSCENQWRHDATLPYLFIFFYGIIIIMNAGLLDLSISNYLLPSPLSCFSMIHFILIYDHFGTIQFISNYFDFSLFHSKQVYLFILLFSLLSFFVRCYCYYCNAAKAIHSFSSFFSFLLPLYLSQIAITQKKN